MSNEKGKGLRFNEGKNRLDLVPTSLIEEVGKVLTFGIIHPGIPQDGTACIPVIVQYPKLPVSM